MQPSEKPLENQVWWCLSVLSALGRPSRGFYVSEGQPGLTSRTRCCVGGACEEEETYRLQPRARGRHGYLYQAGT